MNIFKRALGALAAKMKENKHLELIVYVLLAALGILLYTATFSNNDAKSQRNAAPVGSREAGTAMEGRLAEVLEKIDGAGRVEVMIAGEEEIKGVIVVAEGARDIAVRLELENAVSTVLGIEKEDVNVFEMVREEKADE